MPGIGTFISAGRSLEQATERVRLAESLGYDSTYVTHIAGRDSLTVLAAYAAATEQIRLGTGVLPIYSRTPAATAQTAATIDELSGGRMVLGVGVSHRLTVEAWYGQSIDRPVAEMREYVGAIRAMFRGEEPPEGEKWPTKFRFMGYDVRPELPIYVAALSPNMLRLAGEIGDGVLLWLCDPPYVRDVVIPEVTKGRERAGKGLEGFDIVPAVPAAVTADRDATLERLRGDLVTYLSLPFYRSMLERSGFGGEIAGFDEGIAAGDVERAKASMSEAMLDSLGGFGGGAEVRGAVERYLDAGATSPGVSPVPTADFDATLAAGAELI
ncbi:MAG TPA: LLM class flavin-dependent oxidoreductase [Solirubrobacterales bacterium]|jgi:alkanesulfonate monooxygenase SsuD/methylene tetrahydromethanopterin reductase-like flavin-dependent oxidoreductase (luciferase family)|nr:LLM class flavin-dependent oxidoreductase [Solirubrobacterales bacterium]